MFASLECVVMNLKVVTRSVVVVVQLVSHVSVRSGQVSMTR